jgi:ferric-dicitrate binding protein FerR (iron transport regulator)
MEGRLSYVLGDVFINENPASEGDAVTEGDVIRTGPDSAADVEIKDFSIFHIKENTEIEVENILTSPKLKVKKGWFLIIVKKDAPLEVGTPTVLAGVRGTVFFFKVYDDDTVYLCDCNGKIELFDTRSGESLRLIKSHYHTAFDLNRSQGTVSVKRTRLRYHEDDDILRMAERFPTETRVFKNKKEGGSSYA